MPRDYFQRRRYKRLLTNIVSVGVFSAVVAWALIRQPPTPSFPVRESNANAPSVDFGTNFDAPQQEIADAALQDDARGTDIHVRLRFPQAAGKFPVIVFSPDNRESQDCCEQLIRDWASHGYVVVQLTRVTALRERSHVFVESVRLKRAIHNHANVAPSAAGPLDITSVIDSLAALQTRFPAIRGKLDAAHIGVAGNGAGAIAAEAIAGALLELPGRPQANLADPRVRAVLCISPQGPGHSGFTERSFDQLVLPYLGITSTRDAAPAKFAAAASHKTPFALSQPGDKYELFSRGDGDASMLSEGYEVSNDSSPNGQPSDSIVGHTRAAMLAFWEAYLKHDVAAKRYLQSDALERASRGALTLERR
jgi:predicted dienelactone hydrolase